MKGEKYVLGGAILFGIALLAINASANGTPTEVWVDDDFDNNTPGWGYDHFDSIQDGIDAVDVGGIVHVWNGNYYEDVFVDKTVTIIGNTTVDALTVTYQELTNLSYEEYGFWVEADYVNISGFNLECVGGDFSGIHLNQSDHCNISGNVISDDPSDGICIENSSYNVVYNNVIGGNGAGVLIVNSSHNQILKNFIVENEYGIMILGNWSWGWWFSYNKIKGNNITENFIGIELDGTDNETISKNNITGNFIGIDAFNCENITIEDNNISLNGLFGPVPGYGIYFWMTNYSEILDNTMLYNVNGIEMDECVWNTVDGNEIVGFPMIPLTEGKLENGEYFTAGISINGFGMYSHNTIQNNNVSNFTFGIMIMDSDNETVVGNTIFNNTIYGIFLAGVNDSYIGDNNLTQNGMAPYYFGFEPPSGIMLMDCFNVTVERNTVNGSFVSETGIVIMNTDGIGMECNNTIINNTVFRCYVGIVLLDTDNETVIGNTVFDNYCGIDIGAVYINLFFNIVHDNYYGIYLEEGTNHTNITGNSIYENSRGIYVYGGYEGDYYCNADTEIHWNKIYNNSNYGLVYEIKTGGTPYINATYNWWGNGNGPSNSSMIDPVTGEWANGTGDAIGGGVANDNIHFDPWIGKIMLYQGWNMITMPVWNDSIDTAEELGDYINEKAGWKICTVITKWDASEQQYISHVVDFGADFSLNPGEGYFVFVRADICLSINGTIVEPDVNITLKPGYNLIGHTKVMMTTALQIGQNISNCVKVGRWNASATPQQWVPECIVAYGINNFDVIAGDAVLIYRSEGVEKWYG